MFRIEFNFLEIFPNIKLVNGDIGSPGSRSNLKKYWVDTKVPVMK